MYVFNFLYGIFFFYKITKKSLYKEISAGYVSENICYSCLMKWLIRKDPERGCEEGRSLYRKTIIY